MADDVIPNTRVPTQELYGAAVRGAYEDRDNFVRDLVTVVGGGGVGSVAWGGDGSAPPVTPSPSAVGRPPVLTLDEVKMHVRVEPDETYEDVYLVGLEMAARIHTENFLRYQIDADVGENVKQAMLFLIGHFYRNREAITSGRANQGLPVPLAYVALLYPERDFPTY